MMMTCRSNPLGRLHSTILSLLTLLFTAENYPYILFASFNCDEIACQPYVCASASPPSHPMGPRPSHPMGPRPSHSALPYDDVTPTPMMTWQVGATLFLTFIFFGTITLMSVFVAVLFDVYKRQHGYVVLAERVEEQKALLAAFALLDTSGDGALDTTEFDRLLIKVRVPRRPRSQALGNTWTWAAVELPCRAISLSSCVAGLPSRQPDESGARLSSP